MSFDWTGFLDSHQIPYITQGANVAKGHVSIHCPYCGSADPSHHLTIHLEGKGWRCYRNEAHRGKKPTRLVKDLLGISWEQAARLVGDQVFIPEDFLGALHAKLGVADAPKRKRLKMPKSFRPLLPKRAIAKHYVNYLMDRGYTLQQIGRLYDHYGLHFADDGPMKGRIIFPVYHEGELISWTGRSIYENAAIRYKTLSPDAEEGPKAVGPISDYLLFFDELYDMDLHTLMLVEGPFDALKVNVLGNDYGVGATCCFTATPSEAQMELLREIAPRYKRRLLALDAGTLAGTVKVSTALADLRMAPCAIPSGLKDPGELSPKTFRAMLGRYI